MRRNNKFWIILVYLCYSPLLDMYAQSICDFGMYGGTNMSKLSKRFFSYNNRWGYQAGFTVKVGSKWCQYEADLGYSNMGAKYNLTTEIGQVEGG